MLTYAGFWLLDIWEVYLLALRSKLRFDLKDTATPYRWENDELDRAISKAVSELSHILPLEQEMEFDTTSGSREVDISSLTDLVRVIRVEYPVDKDPRSYVYFEVYENTLFIGGSKVPSGDKVRVRWGKMHSLSVTQSTIPSLLDDVVLMGAQAFAVLARAQYATETDSGGGWDADRDYERWGRHMLNQFYKAIKRQATKRQIKQATLSGESY